MAHVSPARPFRRSDVAGDALLDAVDRVAVAARRRRSTRRPPRRPDSRCRSRSACSSSIARRCPVKPWHGDMHPVVSPPSRAPPSPGPAGPCGPSGPCSPWVPGRPLAPSPPVASEQFVTAHPRDITSRACVRRIMGNPLGARRFDFGTFSSVGSSARAATHLSTRRARRTEQSRPPPPQVQATRELSADSASRR